MFCAGVGVVFTTPMPGFDRSTKPVNYIMFCVGIGVVISTPMPQIDMSLYACDVGKNTLCETLSR